jgi:hypothetical protein
VFAAGAASSKRLRRVSSACIMSSGEIDSSVSHEWLDATNATISPGTSSVRKRPGLYTPPRES